MKKWLYILAMIASVVGVIVSFYSLSAHFDTDLYGVCNINNTFDCVSVNTSEYSVLLGIPVALLGVIAYLVLLIGLYFSEKQGKKKILDLITILSGGSLLFSFYLTSIESFVLHKWCLFCITSQISILVIAIIVIWLQVDFRKNKK